MAGFAWLSLGDPKSPGASIGPKHEECYSLPSKSVRVYPVAHDKETDLMILLKRAVNVFPITKEILCKLTMLSHGQILWEALHRLNFRR